MDIDSPKYPKETIKDIAQRIDMGMICFLNTDTLEVDCVLGESYLTYGDEEYDKVSREVYDKVDSWEHSTRIDPPESWESFKIMEDFIEYCIPDQDTIKERLWTAISKRKPFQNFKYIIDDSKYRQSWFDFKQMQLEKFVLNQLL
ncbi:UPF0158 family protein [Bacteroides sp. 51]|uniref:UPF0158 family protein n=1 Tax=Bacteroides sp. 51 TaxID=2302938 RepID=UPI0013CF811C|nr:UPF0158 family protein [Bacteroides sp. 51]NDV83972.1 hypothetical protein [Bacteroides sp. 51]